MALDWKLTVKEAGKRCYVGTPPAGGKSIASVFQVATGGWVAVFNGREILNPGSADAAPTPRRAAGLFSANRFRTAWLAMLAADGRHSHHVAQEYRAAEASGFAADKEAGAKAGAAFAAETMSLPRMSPERCEKVRMMRRGSDYIRLAANAHCGVFAPEARKRAFSEAWQDAARAEVSRRAEANRATREASPAPHPFAERRPASGRVPARVAFLWEELSDTQRAAILARKLPGFHPSNIPNESEARRAVFYVRADDVAGLNMGIGENARRAEQESRIRREARAKEST